MTVPNTVIWPGGRSQFQEFCRRCELSHAGLESLSRRKGCRLRVATFMQDKPSSYYIYPPGVKTVRYGERKSPYEARSFMLTLPDKN